MASPAVAVPPPAADPPSDGGPGRDGGGGGSGHDLGQTLIPTDTAAAATATASRPGLTPPVFSSLGTYAFLTLFSVLGVLARIGLARDAAPGSGFPRHASLWALALGCLAYGAASQLKPILTPRSPAATSGFLTGFCGSLTTFSSWQLEASLVLVRWPTVRRQELQPADISSRVLGWLTILVVGLGVAVSGMLLGRSLVRSTGVQTPPSLCSPKQVPMTAVGQVGAGLAFVALSTGLAVPYALGNDDVALSVLFAPFGTALRYLLGRRWNGASWFPRGTFAANMLGTAVVAAIAILLEAGPSPRAANVLTGISTGFAGCLTTVSTFVGEVHTLDQAKQAPRRALAYVAVSVAAAQALLALVLTSYLGR